MAIKMVMQTVCTMHANDVLEVEACK